MDNPYQAPESNVEKTHADYTAGYTEQRPSTPKVVGIIMLVLTILGFLGMLMSLGMLLFGSEAMVDAMLKSGTGVTYMYITLILGVISSIFLVYVGIQLIKYRERGRKFFNYYMIYMLVMTPLSFVYQYFAKSDSMDEITFYSGLIGGVVGILIYALFWYLINRPHVKAVLV